MASRGPTTKVLEERLNKLRREVGGLQVDFLVQRYLFEAVLTAQFKTIPNAVVSMDGFEKDLLTQISRYVPDQPTPADLFERIRNRARALLMEAMTRIRQRVSQPTAH